MDYIRERKSNISFSLHDSRILQIEVNEDKLSLNMDRIFQYTDNEEKWYKGIIEFTNIDKEECNIMVFNAPYGYNEVKSFSGKELSFDEFKEQYPNPDKPEKLFLFSTPCVILKKKGVFICYSLINTLIKFMASLPVMTA